MLTPMQAATMKVLSGNDPELTSFLKTVSRFINAPKVFSYLLNNGIKGPQLRQLVLSDYKGDPERFIKGMINKINGKVL